MKNNQDFELLSIKDIFDNGNRCFIVPGYQRGYSWEQTQRDDLMKDIEYIISSKSSYRHYTGTIVASKDEKQSKDNDIETFNIVDGQQRMMSLVILISVLFKNIKKLNIQEYNSDWLFKTFIAEGKEQGNTKRKFISGEQQDNVFRELVFEGPYSGPIDSKSSQNMINAYHEFSEWLNKFKNSTEIVKCLIENLGFLFYAPENESEIGIMFEVINNRGKLLSQFEKVKNYLIYYAQKNSKRDLEDTVNKRWPNILKRLNEIDYTSNDDEDSFLRNCWIVYKEVDKSKSYQVYNSMKDHYPPEPKNDNDFKELIEFIKFMENASLTYSKFLGEAETETGEEKRWLKRIKYHPQNASITPLIIAISNKIQTSKERIRLFELLEKLNFRFYGTGIANRTDSGQGELFSMAHKLFNFYRNKEKGTGTIIDENWLYEELTKFINERANDSAFVQHLTLDKDESGDYYNWQGLKFFLVSYEEYLREKQKESLNLDKFMKKRDPKYPNDFFHREHIWAIKEIKYAEKDDVNKRRLGNFILLKETQNIKVSNKLIEEKIELYWKDRDNDPNTLMIRELSDIFNKAKKEVDAKWSRRTENYWHELYTHFLDSHEELFVNFALERWRVKELKNNHTSVKIYSDDSKNEVYSYADIEVAE